MPEGDTVWLTAHRLDRALRDRRLATRMLLQVHDELVFEVPGPELDDVTALVRAEMEGAAALSVPLLVERSAEAGLKGIVGGANLVQTDYNNDGHMDILVLRGTWLGAAGRHPKSLLRNNGNGTFTDVSFEAGLAKVHYPTEAAACWRASSSS